MAFSKCHKEKSYQIGLFDPNWCWEYINANFTPIGFSLHPSGCPSISGQLLKKGRNTWIYSRVHGTLVHTIWYISYDSLLLHLFLICNENVTLGRTCCKNFQDACKQQPIRGLCPGYWNLHLQKLDPHVLWNRGWCFTTETGFFVFALSFAVRYAVLSASFHPGYLCWIFLLTVLIIQRETVGVMHLWSYHMNSLSRVELFWGDMTINMPFLPFSNTVIARIVEIPPRGRQRSLYPTLWIPRLLATW